MSRHDPGAKRKPPSPAELRGETHDPSAIITILARSRNGQRDDSHDHPAASPVIEPTVTIADWLRILRLSRRGFERLRSSGRIPQPDVNVGTGSRSPRWLASTVRRWLEEGGQA
jgi:hypothetical protein